MRVDEGFVLREIAGDYVIIPTGKTVLDFNGMITVNEVGVLSGRCCRRRRHLKI